MTVFLRVIFPGLQQHFTISLYCIYSWTLFLYINCDIFCCVTFSHILFESKTCCLLLSNLHRWLLSYMYAFENCLFVLNFVWRFFSWKCRKLNKVVKMLHSVIQSKYFNLCGIILLHLFSPLRYCIEKGENMKNTKMYNGVNNI